MKPSGFSPKARWDKRASDTITDLGEPIQVMALFKSGKISPVEFHWNNQAYRISRVNYNWSQRQGAQLINYFSVECGPNLYQISFNNTTLSWKIDKVIA